MVAAKGNLRAEMSVVVKVVMKAGRKVEMMAESTAVELV